MIIDTIKSKTYELPLHIPVTTKRKYQEVIEFQGYKGYKWEPVQYPFRNLRQKDDNGCDI